MTRHTLSHRAAYRTAVLALTWLGGTAGHDTGDYLVQRDSDATTKQQHTAVGRRALATHVLTYGATQALTKSVAYRVAGVRVPLAAQLAGGVVEMVLHGVIDDGRLLRAFSEAVGKLAFHDLAAGGVNGRMLLDQAAHRGLQLPLGAIVTALVAGRRGGAR
jgi:hypothetical protein